MTRTPNTALQYAMEVSTGTTSARSGTTKSARKAWLRLVPKVYEDDVVIALSKPAGIDLERGDSAGLSLVELARELYAAPGVTVVNRLSRFESGVAILAKSPDIADFIRNGLKDLKVEQEYIAVLAGDMKESRVVIDPRHGSSRGKSGRRSKSARQPSGDALRGATVVQRMTHGEKSVLARISTYAENTHMLKAQLRAARIPVVGDTIAQRSDPRVGARRRARGFESQALHLAKIAFHHPGLKRRVTISTAVPDFSAILQNRIPVNRLVHAAVVRRMPAMLDPECSAVRLIGPHGEDLDGLAIERFGDCIVIEASTRSAGRSDVLRDAARFCRKLPGVQTVYVKRLAKPDGDDDARLDDATSPYFGTRPADQPVIIDEYGIRFLLRPEEPRAVGLYLDQRDNRRLVRSLAEGRDVLNLFAFTCAFSVAAARGGAASTTSVDISVKSLEWGKENFAANDLPLDNHVFIRSDALDYFARARRQERSFDLILLDPPTFAHGRKKGDDFQVERDLAGHVREALKLLRPDGLMLVATNFRKVSRRWLEEQIKEAAGKRRFQIVERPTLPMDFEPDPRHAKSLLVRFG